MKRFKQGCPVRVLVMAAHFKRRCKNLGKFDVPLAVRQAAERQGYKFN